MHVSLDKVQSKRTCGSENSDTRSLLTFTNFKPTHKVHKQEHQRQTEYDYGLSISIYNQSQPFVKLKGPTQYHRRYISKPRTPEAKSHNHNERC